MCFSIPYKVIKVSQKTALLEGGKVVKLGKDIKVSEGEYIRVIGSIAVDSLSKQEGLKIRRLLKNLNENHAQS